MNASKFLVPPYANRAKICVPPMRICGYTKMSGATVICSEPKRSVHLSSHYSPFPNLCTGIPPGIKLHRTSLRFLYDPVTGSCDAHPSHDLKLEIEAVEMCDPQIFCAFMHRNESSILYIQFIKTLLGYSYSSN